MSEFDADGNASPKTLEYLTATFAKPTLPSLFRNGKARILGFALKKMLAADRAPRYFIGYVPKMAIYDFAFAEADLQAALHFVVRTKRVRNLKAEVGFGRINGESLLNACKAGGLTASKIKAEHIYESAYTPALGEVHE
jgi:hypothetical protein